ncbi:hypothetical protein RND71_017227 [Anisodus tanguticus]|uniref:Uncharacterized protein n=1 Tax=Anisodus tanguticus TaxID=243964 RepID=A0AAE1S3R6_9SOLA|nr:hypothetical protein RND71_017227 [Anisodus tanguticus]
MGEKEDLLRSAALLSNLNSGRPIMWHWAILNSCGERKPVIRSASSVNKLEKAKLAKILFEKLLKHNHGNSLQAYVSLTTLSKDISSGVSKLPVSVLAPSTRPGGNSTPSSKIAGCAPVAAFRERTTDQ